MKKIISILLVLAIMITLSAPALAAKSITPTKGSNIESTVARLQAEIPDAQIRVVNNVIHIVVDDLSEIPWLTTSSGNHSSSEINSSKVTRVVSSSGGSFRYFDIPWSGHSSYAPYSQVYMSKDVVDALHVNMTNNKLAEYIYDLASKGYSYTKIAELVLATWDYEISPNAVKMLVTVVYKVICNLERWSLEAAQNSSTTGKVSVVRGYTPEGNDSYIYSPWNNNICETYLGYSADWREGVYDVAYG